MFTEIKYLNLISSKLPLFKRKKDFLWNFRCTICGDSQTNKTKCRGYIFQVKGDLVYKCHNCGVGMGFGKFLEIMDPASYKQFKLEKFQENGTKTKKPRVDLRKAKKVVSAKPVFKKNLLAGLEPLDSLNNTHPAKEYILNRKLPTDSLYYTETFKEWTNSVKPGAFESTTKDEPRIIIPFLDKNGELFGFQGRSLSPDGLRYITIMLRDDVPKIFGLNRVDTSRTVYVVEGPLDSLLLDNAVAMAGADVAEHPELLGNDVVYIYDNEPRNKQITDRMAKHIKSGHSLVIFPKGVDQKDINDMVLAGHKVQSMVESNCYQGLKLTLKFNEWRK